MICYSLSVIYWNFKYAKKIGRYGIRLDGIRLDINSNFYKVYNIQLKCYQNKSPCKVYQSFNQMYLTPPIDKSLSLERNLFEKPLRKSSCPDMIKFAPQSNRRRSSYLHDGFLFDNDSDMDIICNSTNREEEVLPFFHHN